MIFLTYNDSYSGIFQSQVIDVCRVLETITGQPVQLVALVSLRNFRTQKRLIQAALPGARVLPMFPKVAFWRMNSLWFRLSKVFSQHHTVWARGPFACNLALKLKSLGKTRKVIFDARGAYHAEFSEYNLVNSPALRDEIKSIEETALTQSDRQLAVSRALVNWWSKQYGFIPENCSIIPCTMAEPFDQPLPSQNELAEIRSKLGFGPQDLVLVYSGSSAGWQSFTLIDQLLFSMFEKNPQLRLIFLSHQIPDSSRTFSAFRDRIFHSWVKPHEVRNLLLAADYGLLVREKSVTNQVSSPVKFAEYLACGLQLIISEGIGDFTSFVQEHRCGTVTNGNPAQIIPVSYDKKAANNLLAREHLCKKSAAILRQYRALLA